MSPPSNSSSLLFSCFRLSTDHHHPPLPPPSPPPPETVIGKNNTNLTTCLYQTSLGLFSLTWSNSFLGHSVHLLLRPTTTSADEDDDPLPLPSSSFHLHLKTFWRKQGSKKIPLFHHPNSTNKPHQLRLYWDLTKAKFMSSGPEPTSGFFIAAMVDQELVLLVGDLTKQALSKTKALKTLYKETLLKIEHMFGNKVYKTRARFGGKNREISIDCSLNRDARLCFNVDNEMVLSVKRLKWNFRGSGKVEVNGVPINISWDVYNWLFKGSSNNGHAVFMFKFEDLSPELEEEGEEKKKSVVLWKRQEEDFRTWRRRRRTERSSSLSSISMSSASSSVCSSSVMEWSSVEEEELVSPGGFSLLVYAWRK